ncbi:MAG TPA: iron-containing alcohol dehydrogenase [Candidatus Brocadiia bacterium]|nr:iron-containing alcohol dehydrogenase [Candidatus Brocadiia bacterium]
MSLFMTVPRIEFGWGAIEKVGAETARLGKRPLFVTGRKSLRASGQLDRIVKLLKASFLDPVVYDMVPPEPDLESIEAGREMLRGERCDCLVCVGGGSAIDVGKAVGALANCARTARAYQQGDAPEKPGVPVLASPTTSGTGAEVTRNSVITDHEANVKLSIRDDTFLPQTVIVDPELTASAPPFQTACSGMDALTQAIEAYTSIYATAITDALSIGAVRQLIERLPAAVADGDDREARIGCAWGSLMTGIAFNNARLGAVHGIAHPLGCRYHIPHGLCCAALLPAVTRVNIASGAAKEKYDALSRLAGGDIADFIQNLLSNLGLPSDLAEFGIREADYDAIVEESLTSGSLKSNPHKFTGGDVISVLRMVSGD